MKTKSLLASYLLLKGLTYPQFAKQVGVSARTISYWSDGVYYPKRLHVPKIENILGVKLIKIFPNILPSNGKKRSSL